jgi:hypothetical protein
MGKQAKNHPSEGQQVRYAVATGGAASCSLEAPRRRLPA